MRNYDPAKSRIYREKNKEKLRNKALEYYRTHKEYFNQKVKERNKKERASIIEYMGGKCARCGFDDTRALNIDHINGGGHQDRKKYSYLPLFYKHIREVKMKGYQLLCANCNQIKKYENNEFRDKESYYRKHVLY